jgi:hypothetical protein
VQIVGLHDLLHAQLALFAVDLLRFKDLLQQGEGFADLLLGRRLITAECGG